MSDCLLDTNVLSYVFKGHSLGKLYLPYLRGKRTAISFMTVAELYEGAARAGWGEPRVLQLEVFLKRHLVLPSSHALCREWAQIRYERRQQPIAAVDGWIAATARAYGLPLVTHNPRDFAAISKLEVVTEHRP